MIAARRFSGDETGRHFASKSAFGSKLITCAQRASCSANTSGDFELSVSEVCSVVGAGTQYYLTANRSGGKPPVVHFALDRDRKR